LRGAALSRSEAVDVNQVVRLFVSLFIFPFVVLPLVGGGAVTAGFRLVKVADVTYWRCWKVYLASCCYGFLALIPLRYLLRAETMSDSVRTGIQLSVFVGVQLLCVPLLLRNWSRKAVAVTCVAVLLANLVAWVVLNDFQLR
jgi:hypothetical protein